MSEHNGFYGDVEMSKECRDWIKELEEKIKYKDLDIEMYKGRIAQIKKLAESELTSWQDL